MKDFNPVLFFLWNCECKRDSFIVFAVRSSHCEECAAHLLLAKLTSEVLKLLPKQGTVTKQHATLNSCTSELM